MIERGVHVGYLPELLDDWDPAEPLHLRRRIRVNIEAAAAALRVPPEHLVLRASLIVGTGGPRGERRRLVLESHDLSVGNPDVEFAAVLEGDQISERVSLRTQLTLGSTAAGTQLSPARSGLELWTETTRLALEPDEARFAIQAESFSVTFPDTPLALWRLDWTPTLMDRDISGNVRLYVNADRRDFVDRISAGDPASLQLMTAGVVEQLVVAVLLRDDALSELEAPTSIASAARGWADQAFPGRSPSSIRELMVNNPSAFSAGLAALAVELGGLND